jgi:hypothetical protein
VQGTDDDKRRAFKEVMVGLRKRMDILAAMPLEKLDGMTIQAELKKLAEVK